MSSQRLAEQALGFSLLLFLICVISSEPELTPSEMENTAILVLSVAKI